MLGWLAQEEGIRLEPSALAGMAGLRVHSDANVTHLVWATGGGMVPEDEMAKYLAKGRYAARRLRLPGLQLKIC
jgi:D-serine dehydratase